MQRCCTSISLVDSFCKDELMSKIKNFVVLLALIAGAIWLFSIQSFSRNNAEFEFNPQAPETQQQTKSEPLAEVQPASTSQDPFKKFLDEKSSNLIRSGKQESTQTNPTPLGKDPFKEFFDMQKQNSKDQVVSPFGKN